MSKSKIAIIIGAGPAGLTAAYELLTRTNIKPIIFEATDMIGGLAQTVNYKGNRIDLGGHRFFSKSQRVVDWWVKFFPLQKPEEQGEPSDQTMLIRKRRSRIYYLRKFFSYPVTLNLTTLKNLGLVRTSKIILTYLKTRLRPIKPEVTLEDFFINRFGTELYQNFFADYTKKVWGKSCSEIPASWGAQRVKGLSITKTIWHAVRALLRLSIGKTETSLIDYFMYPKYGPGQLWEFVAQKVVELGGEIHKNCKIVRLYNSDQTIDGVTVEQNGKYQDYVGDYFFSTMPIKELLQGFTVPAPSEITAVSSQLQYRDFIMVGLLLKKLLIPLPDNWIYVQEPDLKLGRIQVFNNWSPSLVKEQEHAWLGLEYFCTLGDEFWLQEDRVICELAKAELEKIALINGDDVLDCTVIRTPKAYPAYFGAYANFDVIKNYLDRFTNLFLIGRNGMHRYNNMDHSMLTAMVAVDNIIAGTCTKENIWAVNTEDKYHEMK